MSVSVQWVVAMMVALEPNAPWRGTFEKTAEAIGRVAESEPLFDDRGEERTAALLVAVAWYESRLKPNAKSADGHGMCLYQVDRRHMTDPRKALEDPELCTREAMKIIRASFKNCKNNSFDERLAQFTSGRCTKGLADSRYRMFLAGKLLRDHPVPTPTSGGGTARAR